MFLTEYSDQVFLPGGCNRTKNLRFGPYTMVILNVIFLSSVHFCLEKSFQEHHQSVQQFNNLDPDQACILLGMIWA